MRFSKKIISVILTMTMLTSCFVQSTVNLLAADDSLDSTVVANSQNITTIESGEVTLHGNSSSGEADAATRIWLVLETSDKPEEWTRFTPISGEGYVRVNGDDVDSALYGGGSEPAYLLQLSTAVQVDDLLTISGKFTSGDGSYIVNMQETTFQYLGGKWTIYQEVTTIESGDVTLHGNSRDGEAEAASRIWLVLEASDKPELYVRMTAVSGEGYVKVNGDEVDSALYGGGSEPAYLLNLGTVVEKDDLLTISGKFTTADGSYVVNMQETTFIYLGMTEEKGSWRIATTADIYKYPHVTITNVVEPSGYSSEGGYYGFYMKFDTDLALTTEEEEQSQVTGMEYSINGGEKQTLLAYMAAHSDGTFFPVIYMEQVTTNTTITFSGTGSLTANIEKGFILDNDFTIYLNQYGWSTEAYLSTPASTIRGDVNGDSETNVKDLVHFKKSLQGTATVNNQAKLTKNDLDIDEKDVSALRQILVATYHEAEIPYGMPTYVDNREIEMAAYMGPRSSGFNRYQNGEVVETVATNFINDTEFQKYKEAGFTYLLAEADAKYGSETLRTYMQLAEQHNLDVVLMDDAINEMLQGNPEHPVNAETIAYRTSDMLANYPKTFKGWMLRDEPPIAHLGYYTDVTAAIKKIDPRNYLYTACLPYHATIDNFTTDETVTDKGEAYTSYINSYGKLLGEFNYDLYPLQANDALRSDWLQNLALAAGTAKENGFPTGITLQSCEYYTNWGLKNRIPDDEQDIGFQMYTALAYGMRKINYFTYWEHYNQNTSNYYTASMVMYPTDGGTESVTTKIYDAVKSVNTEIKKYDHVLMNYGWEGTLALGGATDGTTGYANSRIASCTATSDAVIGCMKDAVGYDGYMIANANNPATSEETTVTIQFNHATKAIVYIDGEREEVSLENGSYTVTVPIGEGIFVIPVI